MDFRGCVHEGKTIRKIQHDSIHFGYNKGRKLWQERKKKPFVHNQKHFLAPHMASKVTEHAMRYLSLIKMIIYNTINNTINPNTHPVTVQEMKC